MYVYPRVAFTSFRRHASFSLEAAILAISNFAAGNCRDDSKVASLSLSSLSLEVLYWSMLFPLMIELTRWTHQTTGNNLILEKLLFNLRLIFAGPPERRLYTNHTPKWQLLLILHTSSNQKNFTSIYYWLEVKIDTPRKVYDTNDLRVRTPISHNWAHVEDLDTTSISN